jgi:hypothetical protein
MSTKEIGERFFARFDKHFTELYSLRNFKSILESASASARKLTLPIFSFYKVSHFPFLVHAQSCLRCCTVQIVVTLSGDGANYEHSVPADKTDL